MHVSSKWIAHSGRGGKETEDVGVYLLASRGEGRRGSFFSKSKGPEHSAASWTPEECWSARGNRMGILVTASHMFNVIHGSPDGEQAAGWGMGWGTGWARSWTGRAPAPRLRQPRGSCASSRRQRRRRAARSDGPARGRSRRRAAARRRMEVGWCGSLFVWSGFGRGDLVLVLRGLGGFVDSELDWSAFGHSDNLACFAPAAIDY
jgi:hypothetical protein